MEILHLRSLIKVAECGSLTQAAELLCLSQPAVSAHIKFLEEELNIALFHRTARGMVLTEAGKLLLKEAENIVLRVDGMGHLANRLRNHTVGILRMGLTYSGYDFQFPRMVGLVTQRHPEVEIKVLSANSGAHLQALHEHKIDMAIVESEHLDKKMRGWRIGASRVGIIGPATWQDRLMNATWSDLAEFPWIFQSKTCSYYKVMQKVMEQHDIAISPKFQVEALGAIKDMVAEGLALSIIDLDSVAEEEHICVWQGLEVNLPVWLVALEERAKEPAIEAFADIAQIVHKKPRQQSLQNGHLHHTRVGKFKI